MEVWVKYSESQDFQGGMGTLAMELMCNMIKPLWVTVKTYIMDSTLCVLKGLFGMLDICIYVSLLVKNLGNWKTGIHRYEINAHYSFNKEIMTASQYIGRVLILIYLL